jgi:hypothetical protein
MNRRLFKLAVMAAIAAAGGAAHAEQQFGRDSVYAVPGHSGSTVSTRGDAQHFGRDSVYASDVGTPASPLVSAWADRLGRDSVYATQAPGGSSTPVATNATGLQQNGRDSVYAIQFQSPSLPKTDTKLYGSGTGTRHGG